MLKSIEAQLHNKQLNATINSYLYTDLQSAAGNNTFALFQSLAVLLHVLDRLDHTLRALPHLSDGIGGVDEVPVALPNHLSQLLLLLFDFPTDFAFNPTNLLGVVALKQNRRILDLRHSERQSIIISHLTPKTSPTRAGSPTRKFVNIYFLHPRRQGSDAT